MNDDHLVFRRLPEDYFWLAALAVACGELRKADDWFALGVTRTRQPWISWDAPPHDQPDAPPDAPPPGDDVVITSLTFAELPAEMNAEATADVGDAEGTAAGAAVYESQTADVAVSSIAPDSENRAVDRLRLRRAARPHHPSRDRADGDGPQAGQLLPLDEQLGIETVLGGFEVPAGGLEIDAYVPLASDAATSTTASSTAAR